MSSTVKFGDFSLTIFGESHGAAIGAVIDGLPAGEPLDFNEILTFMARRAPKKDGTSTMRNEADFPEILSGICDGKTTGTPLCCVIKNTDQHSADYKSVSHLARPGHADYTGSVRYNGANDLRGGGHFSGRLTAPLVFAGAVCAQILSRKGIVSGAHVKSIADVGDISFDPVNISVQELQAIKEKSFPVSDDSAGEAMKKNILSAREELDSVGGIIECAVLGLPCGIGDPMFDGLENRLSQLLFAIPAVKGVEFGNGFGCASRRGSENNDSFVIENGAIKTATNNCGGILGGISDGMPLIFRAAVKPTPSIARQQKTVDYEKMTEEILEIKGRHDPCIVPRAVACVEAAANIAVLSFLLSK